MRRVPGHLSRKLAVDFGYLPVSGARKTILPFEKGRRPSNSTAETPVRKLKIPRTETCATTI
jgi:hypothetical protein